MILAGGTSGLVYLAANQATRHDSRLLLLGQNPRKRNSVNAFPPKSVAINPAKARYFLLAFDF